MPGIRHFALLKLTGTGQKATGSVHLYPLNGESQSDTHTSHVSTIKGCRGRPPTPPPPPLSSSNPAGRSQSEAEPLSLGAVGDLREQLKISRDYFSMLVVGKDGDVKAWFPSPMWTLDNVYDLVDSLEPRLHEEKLQRRLGIHCPEERGGGGRGRGRRGRGGLR